MHFNAMKMVAKLVPVFVLLLILYAVVEFRAKTLPCPETEIACLCGSPPNGEIKSFPVRNDFMNSEDLQNCPALYAKICEYNSCLYHPVKNINRAETFKEGSSSVIQEVQYPKTAIPPLADADDFQQFPTNCNNSRSPLMHASSNCTYRPEFMTCDIVCSHGYLMEENGKIVSKTVRKCHESEAHWYFPVCKPYINCEVVLISSGTLKCHISGPDITSCDITCDADKEHDATPVKHYDCMDENFAETLPHCVTLDKEVDLLKLPKGFHPED